MERLHILETGFTSIFAPSLKNFSERLFIPADFFVFIYFNN